MRWVWRGVIGVAVLWLAVLAVILMAPGGGSATPGGGAPQGPAVTAGTATPTALGEFSPADPPLPAPDVAFADDAGATVRLADFRGRLVLLNLWATWCDPCIREMPSLDRLAGAFAGRPFTLLAISQDRGGAPVVDPFIARLGLTHVKPYLDPKSTVGHAFAVAGLPTSILIDRDGRVLGRLEGGAQWDAPDKQRLIERHLAPPATELQRAAKD